MIASTNPFEILAPPLASLLAFFYDHVIANYGVAIILMTLTVMVILAPLTWKGTRSMLAMQRLQPELKKIQQQHKNDRAALNEAMMAFYKEHNINPLGGCLPLLLQMPVFFGLFRAVSGLTHKVKGVVHPKFIPQTTRLAKDLTKANGTMKSFGFDLAKAASSHHSSFAAALPYLVLVALIVLTGWYQQRQLTSVNPQAAQANPQAALMQKIFPVFFGLITYRFPAGVAVYWLAQSVARIIQQWAMYRWDKSLTAEVKRDILEVEERTADLDKGGSKASRPGLVGDAPKKGFFARMMEAAATQQEAKGKASGPKPGTKPSTSKPSTNKSTGKPATNKPAPGKAGAKPGDAKANGGPAAASGDDAGKGGNDAGTGTGGAGTGGAGSGGAETGGSGADAGQGTTNGADPPIRPNRPAPSNRAASRKRARRSR